MNFNNFDSFDKKILAFTIIVIVLTITFAGVGVYKDRQAIQKYGPLHCGDVEVVTPSGQRAFEHQCWRSKN